MPYELDTTATDAQHADATDDAKPTDSQNTDSRPDDANDGGTDADSRPDDADDTDSPATELGDAIGVSIPDEHVGAFVAEAFEDAERDTAWDDVVDAFVDPGVRDAWSELSAREQVVEVLDAAARFDERAAETLESVPLDATADDVDGEDVDVAEALRCRRTADQFRDGVASAYAAGRVDDDALVQAVQTSAFDTELLARRESALETVSDVHDVDFRPYGGQLFDAEDGPDPDVDHDATETW